MVARSRVWSGSELPGVVALEVTLDNQSTRSIRVYPGAFALVTPDDSVSALAPPFNVPAARDARPMQEMSERALPEAVLQPGQRTTGFVYFPRIPDDKLELTTTLVDPTTAEQIGTIRMAFEKD